jgi:hypothetical protein
MVGGGGSATMTTTEGGDVKNPLEVGQLSDICNRRNLNTVGFQVLPPGLVTPRALL